MLLRKRKAQAYGNAKQEPKGGEGGCDLPKEIEGKRCVAPDSPTEPQIENAPRYKLNSGNDDRAYQRAQEERKMRKLSVGDINETKAQTAAKSH